VRAVWIGAAIYAVALTLLGVDRYATYHSGADLGEFVQTISSAFGIFGDTAEGGSHYLHHFSPILYLAAPPLLLARSPVALIALQAIAGALVAPAIYLIARSRAPERVALLAGFVALVYPPLVGVTFTDFHENGFGPTAIAWLIWAVDRRRWVVAALFVVAALAIKEDEALVLSAVALLYLLAALRRRDAAGVWFGAGTIVAAALVFACYFSIVRPLVGAQGPWFAIDYFTGHSFDTPHGAAIVLGRLSFLLEVFVPLLFVPLRTPWILFAVPGLVEVLSSRWSITYTNGQHYAGVWIAYVLAAFAVGLAAIARDRPPRARAVAGASLALCALNLIVASPTHWAHYLRARNAHDAALDTLVARVPPGAGVATYDEVYSHLGFDPAAQIGFSPDPQPPYALFDERYDGGAWLQTYRPRLAELVREGRYVPLATADGATLYRRSGPAPRAQN
jgi:uncharacterized membrane protein